MGGCASKPRSADSNPQMQQEQVSTYTSELNLEEDEYLRKYSRSKRSLSVLFKEEEEEEREHLLKQEIQEKDIIQQHKVSKPSVNAVVSKKQKNSTTKIEPPASEIQHDVLEDNVKLEASEASVQKPVEAATKPESEVSQPSVNAMVSEKQKNLTTEIQSQQSKIQNDALGDNVKLEASEASMQEPVEAPTKPKNDMVSDKQENSTTKIQSLSSQIQNAALEDSAKLEALQEYVQKPIEAPTKLKSEVSKPSSNAVVSEKQENLTAKIQSLPSEIQNDVLEDNAKLEASEACVQKPVEAPTKPKSDVSKPSVNAIVSEKQENLTAKIQSLPSEIQNVVIEDNIKIEASHAYEQKLAEAPTGPKSGVSKPSVNTSEQANSVTKIQSLPSEVQTVVIEEGIKLEASQPYVQKPVEAPAKPKSEVSKPPGNARVCEKQETSITKNQSLSSEICNAAVEDSVKLEASQAYVQKPVKAPTKHSTCTVGSDISRTNEKTEVGTVLLKTSGNDAVDLAARNSLESGIRLQIDADHTSNIVDDRHLGTTKPTKVIADVGDSWENSPKSELNLPMVDTGLASEKYVVDNDAKDSFNPGFKVPSVGLNHSSNDIEDKDLGKASSRTENIDLITVENLHGNSLTIKTQQFLESEKALGIDPMSSITSVSIPASSDVAASVSSGKELEEGLKTEGLGRMKWVGEGDMRAESREVEVVDAQAEEQAVHRQALVPDHLATEVGIETRDLHRNANWDNESLGNNIDYSSKIHEEKLSQKDQSLVIESAVEESRATTSTHLTEEPEEYNTEVPIMERMKGVPDNSVYAKQGSESAVMEVDSGPRDTSFETSRRQDPLK